MIIQIFLVNNTAALFSFPPLYTVPKVKTLSQMFTLCFEFVKKLQHVYRKNIKNTIFGQKEPKMTLLPGLLSLVTRDLARIKKLGALNRQLLKFEASTFLRGTTICSDCNHIRV